MPIACSNPNNLSGDSEASHGALQWWKSAVIYHIYTSSFLDSNGDGIGDLNGISAKLDYLKDLGVDVVYLSPIYKSPMKDMGYDISDYRDIDPRYGTLEDWDRLVEGLHERGMKIMMDLVVNHSSDEHTWFKESKISKTSPKRDWYFWRPPRYSDDGERLEPNNWRSHFLGSAWEFDQVTEEYYLHLYLPGQPDLNWDNKEVRTAVYEMMDWWLDRGVDGFRMDVINLISKVPGLPDAPVNEPEERYQSAIPLYANGPLVHQYLKEMNMLVISKRNTQPLTLGEISRTRDMHVISSYCVLENKELDTVLQFELFDLDIARDQDIENPPSTNLNENRNERHPFQIRKWKLTELKEIINRWQNHLKDEGFWNIIHKENHDSGRSVSRFGCTDSPRLRELSAKLLAMLQITQGGSVYIYQGEEMGMTNVPKDWGIDEYKDVNTSRWYDRILKQRMRDNGADTEEDIDMTDVMFGIQRKARDNGRTPIQWDASPNAGFTPEGTQPWMRVNDDYVEWNIEHQLSNILTSVLGFWKELLKVRRSWKVLAHGRFSLIPSLASHEKIFAFVRSFDPLPNIKRSEFGIPAETNSSIVIDSDVCQAALVFMNFSTEHVVVDINMEEISNIIGTALEPTFRLAMNNYMPNYLGNHLPSFQGSLTPGASENVQQLKLKPYEGHLYRDVSCKC